MSRFPQHSATQRTTTHHKITQRTPKMVQKLSKMDPQMVKIQWSFLKDAASGLTTTSPQTRISTSICSKVQSIDDLQKKKNGASPSTHGRRHHSPLTSRGTVGPCTSKQHLGYRRTSPCQHFMPSFKKSQRRTSIVCGSKVHVKKLVFFSHRRPLKISSKPEKPQCC